MCEILGASFERNRLEPYFKLAGDDRNIYIIFDPSHMLKLARNSIGKMKTFTDGNNLKIEWEHFESLEELRVNHEYTHAHKVTEKHMQYDANKMNVRLAAETLSNSVANSMQYLMNEGHEKFSNCSATIKYVRVINDIFDTMNTKRINEGNILKSAINPHNKTEIFALFDKAIEYLQEIKLPSGEKVIHSVLKTSFRGFVTNMINLKSIYEEYVESNLMDCLPTFRFSQDFLESLFGRIRSLPGCNDNPTVEQFNAAMRKILINDDIKCSEKANCQDSLKIAILDVPSTYSKSSNINTEDIDSEQFARLQKIKEQYKSSEIMKASIAYLAGEIEQKIANPSLFTCMRCVKIIPENDKIADSIPSQYKPCQTTFDICNVAHKYVQYLRSDSNYTYSQLLSDIGIEYDSDTAFPKTNFEGHESHKKDFVDFIISEYIRTQATYIAKKVTLKEQNILIRKKFTKLVQHFGQ